MAKRPAMKPSSSSRQRYEFNAEGIAALRAALADDPVKLQRLEERLVHDAEQAARRTALEKKIALLKSRNAALRAAAQPPTPPPTPPPAPAIDYDAFATASVTSSTSAGNTVSPHDSTLTRVAAADVPTRGPSSSSTAAQSTHMPLVTLAAIAAPSPPADEFDERTINADTAPVPDTWGSQKSIYRYAGPSVKGMVSSVMKDGVLYRIITDKGEWAFYNDTRYYVAQVRYRLLGGSAVTPGPLVRVAPAGPDQELSMELGPEETKVLLKGRVVDFENLSAATLLPRRAATSAEDLLLCQEPLAEWRVISTGYPPAAAASDGSGGGGSRSKVQTEGLLAHCMEHHIRFVDPAFFPCHAALYRHDVDEFFIAALHWRSPFTYLPDEEKVRREVRLFRGPRLNPDGLRAGHLFPDRTFLSCISGLACHSPEQLRSVFLHPSGAVEGRRERVVGAYRLRLCRDGWWESLVVDGFIPASSTCPEFSHCADDLRLLWLQVLQKACAKLWGSYAALLNASMESLVGLLTGGPCCTLRELWPSREDLRTNTAKATRFFATLKKVLRTPSFSSSSLGGAGLTYLCWLRPYSPTTARSQDTRDKLEKLYGDVGLSPGTAAVVLGMETLADGQCVVRLRQTAEPQQSAETWLNVWRAAKKPWVDAVEDLAFGLEDAEGSVWMGLEDIPQYFQSGHLAPLTADWAVVKARGGVVDRMPSLAVQVEVTVPTLVVVSVTQTDTETEGKRRKRPTVATTAAASTVSEAAKTDGMLAGLSCLAFAKGTEDALRFVGSSGDSADVFDISAAPHYAYERDVSVGLRLDPSSGPFLFVPCTHVTSLDVTYTVTVQAVADSPASKKSGSAPKAAALTARFVKLTPDAALFQAGATPLLRGAAITPYSTPLKHQARPLGSQRIVVGEGSSVTLAL